MSIRCSLGHENLDGAAYCDECGEALGSAAPVATATAAPPASAAAVSAPPSSATVVCPACGASNPAGEAFCSNCGVNLQGAATPMDAQAAPVAPSAPAAPSSAPELDALPSAAPVAVASGLHARLIVEADNQEFDLSGKDNIVLGREDAVSNIFPDVDLTPHGGEEGGVSRLHAHIFVENGQYMLEDDNSTNFTFLNRQRLAAKTPTPLNDNDEVRLGRVLLRFKTS